jgi:hypothetical protein
VSHLILARRGGGWLDVSESRVLKGSQPERVVEGCEYITSKLRWMAMHNLIKRGFPLKPDLPDCD